MKTLFPAIPKGLAFCGLPYQPPTRRHGFSLVEMLVAMGLSLLIILAVTQVFRLVGDNVLASRAVMEMSGELRGAANRLERDLQAATVSARPWNKPGSGAGYLEVIEGPRWDMGLPNNAGVTTFYPETSMGDIDDVLMFTARSEDQTFVGQIQGHIIPGTATTPPRLVYNANETNPIESRLAEIVWFTRFNDINTNGQPDPGEVTVHRRALLILPNLDLSHPSVQQLTPGQFYSAFDLSAAIREVIPATAPRTWLKLPNTLESLTQRENRIAHNVSGGFPLLNTGTTVNQPFPYKVSPALLVPQGTVLSGGSVVTIDSLIANGTLTPANAWLPFSESYGSDVALSETLAFDVKVYDQTVPLRTYDSEFLLPGDPGYLSGTVPANAPQGGYVDLWFNRYAPGISSWFSGQPNPKSQLAPLAGVVGPVVYDTWTTYYERDGVDQDGVMGADQGTDGLDNDSQFGADDVLERETAPPYNAPLRGIQVQLRIIDRASRQVRQVTVTSDFIPE